MTYRYIFLMLQTAHDMFEARRSRTVGELVGSDSRRLAAATAGVLLAKSFHLSSETYLAMQSRGFRGQVSSIDEFRMHVRDWITLALGIGGSIAVFWFGRLSDGLFK